MCKYKYGMLDNNLKRVSKHTRWLEGTRNISVWLEKSYELLFSFYLAHQLDAHNEENHLAREAKELQARCGAQ